MPPLSYSGFHIKRALIPISLQGQAGDPRRCLAHLLTYLFYRGVQRTFDDHFIVDMSDYPVVPQSVHGMKTRTGALAVISRNTDPRYPFWKVEHGYSCVVFADRGEAMQYCRDRHFREA